MAGEASGVEVGLGADPEGVSFHLDAGKNLPTNKDHLKGGMVASQEVVNPASLGMFQQQ